MILLRIILIIFLFSAGKINAQISHGGRPLPYLSTRSSSHGLFQEMPPFDVEEELRMDSLLQTDLKGGYRFAYKFITDFTPGNSGEMFTLADGTKVWRLGIRSAGAYSINVLFTEYEVPEGAGLFLYSPDQSQVLGSFNHLNNSDLHLLPVAPVHGEEVIIEYREPPGAEFAGRIKVGEVNHGYRDIRGKEPGSDVSQYACMPALLCASDTTTRYDEIIRSVVILIINGDVLCSGVLLNNTRNDTAPYLLTASHCLNKSFTVINPDYARIAGTIVSFFNYESPFCSTILRGAGELSMASARYRAVNTKTDLALLELTEVPPVYYRPYYAGWDISEKNLPPYTNLHHPGGATKRINICSKDIKLISYSEYGGSNPYGFNPNSFWQVSEWEVGSTAGGSSGSPLFDKNNRVTGALTGGQSFCDSPKNDVFYALSKSWTSGNADSTNLQPWLAPNKNTVLSCEGFDPYSANKAVELSNLKSSGYRESATTGYLPAPNSGHQFGVNSLGTTEYAEAFTIDGDATLYGASFVTPAIRNNTALQVEVKVYGAQNNTPGDSLSAALFAPSYTNMNIPDDEFRETAKPLNRAQESFIKFDSGVNVSGKFFIAYKITASERDSFTVYNLPENTTGKNSTWIKYQNKWIENSSHPSKPFKTSLYINPVIQKKETGTGNEEIRIQEAEIRVDRTSGKVTITLPDGAEKARYDIVTTDGKPAGNGYITERTNSFILNQKGIFIVRLYLKNKTFTSKIIL